MSQQINSIELVQTRPLAPPEVGRPQRPLQRQVHLRGRPASRPTVIRGVTYYKAKDPEEENDIEEQRELGSAGGGGGGSRFGRCGDAPPPSRAPPAASRPTCLPRAGLRAQCLMVVFPDGTPWTPCHCGDPSVCPRRAWLPHIPSLLSPAQPQFHSP